MNFWKKRKILKSLTFSVMGIVLFTGEKCLADCPETLEGKTIRNFAVAGEATLADQKLILDEGSEHEDIGVRGHLMAAKLDLLEGVLIKPEKADPKHSSKCTYQVHDKENKRHITIHVRVEGKMSARPER